MTVTVRGTMTITLTVAVMARVMPLSARWMTPRNGKGNWSSTLCVGVCVCVYSLHHVHTAWPPIISSHHHHDREGSCTDWIWIKKTKTFELADFAVQQWGRGVTQTGGRNLSLQQLRALILDRLRESDKYKANPFDP